jgi:hypothetical protein
MTFETDQDLKREHKAITTFVNTFGGTFQKLDPQDVDYKIFDKEGKLIAYAEVKSRIRTMHDAYPLPVQAKKIVKLVDKRLAPVIIWSCEDGIIYGKIDKLRGEVKWGSNATLNNSINNLELMIFYNKQKDLKYIRFV